jgi:hypothetical protein
MGLARNMPRGKPTQLMVGQINFYGFVPGVGRDISFAIPAKTARMVLRQSGCAIKLLIIPNKPVAEGSNPSIDRVELWAL